MKILLVIDSLNAGGAQRQFALLARGLAGRGHNVDIFLYQPQSNFYAEELEHAAIRTVSTKKNARFDLGPVMSLRALLRGGAYDAAVAFLVTPSLYLISARGLRRRPPVIMSHRQAYDSPIPTIHAGTLSLFRFGDAIVSNSHLGAEQIVAKLPFLTKKVHVIINGVELPPRHPEQHRRAADGKAILAFLGRLAPQKNIHTLLPALAELRKRGVALPRIVWAGRNEQGPAGEAYANLIQSLVQEHALSACWTPLGQRSDTREILAASDALILPSTFEGTANVICEAMAAARPVLAGRAGDNARLVEHGVSGLLFDPRDAGDIADKLQCFLGMSAEEQARMGSSARQFAEQYLSVNQYVSRWEELIERISRTAEARTALQPT